MKKLSRSIALLLAALMVICSCFTAMADQEVYTFDEYDYDAFTATRNAVLSASRTEYNVVSDLGAKATVTVDMGSDGQITDGDSFTIKVEWSVPNDHTDASATYVYQLPSQFTMKMESTDGTVSDSTGTILYYWSLDSNNKITIQFDSAYMSENSEKYVYFNFPGIIDVGDNVTPGENVTIEVPGGDDIVVIIPEQEVPAEKQKPYMQKYVERVYLNENGQYVVDYKIKIAPENNCTNVVVKDYIGSSYAYASYENNMHLVEGSVKAWVYSHLIPGGASVDKPEFSYKDDGNADCNPVLVWELGAINKGGTMYGEGAAEITYSVILDWDGKSSQTFYNTATSQSDNSEVYMDQHAVRLTPPTITKTGTDIDENGYIEWTINVNFNNSLTATVVEEPGNAYKELFNLDANKNATVSITYKDGTTNTCTVADLLTGKTLTVNEMGQTAQLVFKMYIPDDFRAEHYVVRNDVRILNGPSASDEAKVSEHPMKSKSGELNLLNKTVTWTVELDFKQKPSSEKPYVDSFNTYDNANVYMVDGSFGIICPTCGVKKLKNGSTPAGESEYCQHAFYVPVAEPNSDSNYNDSGQAHKQGHKLFDLYFTGTAPSGEYTLKYTTNWSLDSNSYSSEVDYRNYMIDAIDDNQYVHDAVQFDSDFIHKYSDDGLREYTDWSPAEVGQKDNKVSWYISFTNKISKEDNPEFFNDWKDGNKAVCVYETLPQGFEVNAVYWVKADGSKTEITSDCGFTTANLYRIPIPYDDSGIKIGTPMNVYEPGDYIRIDTTYTGEEVSTNGKSFTNSAWFSIDQKDANGEWLPDYGPQNTATTTIKPEPKISKSKVYSNDTVPFIQYTVTVNPSGENLIQNDENGTLYVEDTMCDILVFMPNTLRVNGEAWSNYAWDPTTHVLKVRGLADETKYVITYNALVSAQYGTTVTLKNSAVLKGADTTPPPAETTYTGTVLSGYGGATGNKLANIQVLKVDDANKFLAGAEFKITDINGTQIATLVGDDYGVTGVWGMEVSQVGKIFMLQETKAPDGYAMSGTPIYFGVPNENGGFSDVAPSGAEVVELQRNMPMHQFTIVNEPIAKSGSLSITKEVTAAEGVTAPVKEFTFEVTLSGMSGTVDYMNGTTSGTLTLDNDGKGTLTMKADETVTFENIPAETGYTVTETNLPIGFSIENASKTGTIKPGETAEVDFTNTYAIADLTITKQVVGKDAPETDSFEFVVEVKDGETALTGLTYKVGEGTAVALPENGKISLTKGQTATIIGIPVGATYKVTEAEYDDYTTKVGEEVKNEAAGTIAAANNAVTFINTYKYGSLTISKSFAKNPEKGETFVFDVKDSDGNVVTQVVMTGSESVTIHKLPLGQYTVSENDAWSWRYSAASDNTTVTITAEVNPTVSFTNTKNKHQWLDDSAYADNNFGTTLPKTIVD